MATYPTEPPRSGNSIGKLLRVARRFSATELLFIKLRKEIYQAMSITLEMPSADPESSSLAPPPVSAEESNTAAEAAAMLEDSDEAEDEAEVEESDSTELSQMEQDEFRQEALAAAKEAYYQASVEQQRCEQELKSAKTRVKAAFDYVRSLESQGPGESTGENESSDSPPSNETDARVAAAADSPPANEQWRQVSIDRLELPEFVIDKLYEASVRTIGHLEDLRAEIAAGRQKWPKGIGETKITKIEDGVIAWLSKNRDQWGEAATAPAPAPTPEDSPALAPAGQSMSDL